MAPGTVLRLVRTTLRMSQVQLSRRAGIDQAHIARLEAGKIDAQWKTWRRLFSALQCKLVLRIQAKGGLQSILEERIRHTVLQKEAWADRTFPNSEETEEERQEDRDEMTQDLRDRRTSDTWDEIS